MNQPTNHHFSFAYKRLYSPIVAFAILLGFVQCKDSNSSDTSVAARTQIIEDGGNIISDSLARQLVRDERSTGPEQKQVDTIILDESQYYRPSVETCIYIRSSPSSTGDNIIQCLIPLRSEDYITAMYHELLPTGEVEGNWAEFRYSFDIYTMKPDVQEDVNFQKWQKQVYDRHEVAKSKYGAVRKVGWLKYRNDDGSYNIEAFTHEG